MRQPKRSVPVQSRKRFNNKIILIPRYLVHLPTNGDVMNEAKWRIPNMGPIWETLAPFNDASMGKKGACSEPIKPQHKNIQDKPRSIPFVWSIETCGDTLISGIAIRNTSFVI